VKLRYTGPDTVTFLTAGVGEVEPGAEFTVPDELAEAFLRRGDIEEVSEDSPVKPSQKKKPAMEFSPKPLPEPEPAPADAVPAVDTENS
jgi:hypothetical protein